MTPCRPRSGAGLKTGRQNCRNRASLERDLLLPEDDVRCPVPRPADQPEHVHGRDVTAGGPPATASASIRATGGADRRIRRTVHRLRGEPRGGVPRRHAVLGHARGAAPARATKPSRRSHRLLRRPRPLRAARAQPRPRDGPGRPRAGAAAHPLGHRRRARHRRPRGALGPGSLRAGRGAARVPLAGAGPAGRPPAGGGAGGPPGHRPRAPGQQPANGTPAAKGEAPAGAKK